MRILHVDHSSVLGGAERSVLELAVAQRAGGHEVRVAVGRTGPFADALGRRDVDWQDLGWSERYLNAPQLSPSIELVAGLPDLARAAAGLRRAVRRWGPDIVQAHTRKSQLVASLALADVDVPLVWHLRDDLPTRPPIRALIALAMRRADHAVALSRWLANSYASRRALPRSGRIGVVPSGIDPAPLAGLDTPWLDGERDAVVGYVGQIARWKGPHLLIDAAESLVGQPVSFRIIGGVWFPAAEGRYGRWLAARLADSPARDRIKWLPATDRPEQAFAEIDVLAHMSLAPEPFGRVLVEAMAARRPIVALSRGSAAELLDDSTAVFAERSDGPAVARAISAIIEDRPRARRQADDAAPIAARYEPMAIAALMDEEYARLQR